MEKGKLKKSKLIIALYVIAALIAVYGVYNIVIVVDYINTTAQTYDITAMDSFNYLVSSVIHYFVFALLIYMAAVIYNGIRALDPANYLSQAEIEAKEAAKAKKAEEKDNGETLEDEKDPDIN
jgi:hypothetical protein